MPLSWRKENEDIYTSISCISDGDFGRWISASQIARMALLEAGLVTVVLGAHISISSRQ